MTLRKQNLNYINVQPTSGLRNDEVLSGQYKFKFSSGSTSAIDGGFSNMYYLLRGRVKTTANTTIVNTSYDTVTSAISNKINLNAGFANACAASLFDTAVCNYNDILADTITDWRAAFIADRYMNSTIDNELSISGGLLPHGKNRELYLRDPNDAQIGLLTNKNMNTRRRNANMILNTKKGKVITAFDTWSEVFDGTGTVLEDGVEFQLEIPFMFLQTNDANQYNKTVYGNSRITTSFATKSSLKADFFTGVDVAELPNITLQFSNFELCVPIYIVEIPRNIFTWNYIQRDCHSVLHNQSNYSISIPSNTHKIVCFFSYQTGTIGYTPANPGPVTAVIGNVDVNDASAGSLVPTNTRGDEVAPFDLLPSGMLTKFHVTFNSVTFPANYYDFADSTIATAMRAYADYRRQSLSFQNDEIPLLKDVHAWMRQPVIILDVTGAVNNANDSMPLNIHVNAPPTDINDKIRVNLNLVAYYNKSLEVNYSPDGEVLSTVPLIN